MSNLREFITAVLILQAMVAPLSAQQPRRQPAAKEYIKILEDTHRIERLKPQEIINKLQIRPGDIVADIGSGSGLFTRPLAKLVQPGGRIYAVDIDKELLEHVSTTAREQGISNITIVMGEQDSPALPRDSIDLAFICDTLHHIVNRQTYLTNLKTALKPGGRVAIIDFLDEWPSSHESMRFTVAELKKWMDAAGYTKIAEYNTVKGNFFQIYKVK